MARRIVLFDLDGTLTDPKVGITRSVQHALRSLDREADDLDRLVGFIGPPLAHSFVELAGLDPADVPLAIAAYREYFSVTGIFENALFEGIPELLDGLCSSGFELALATSKPLPFALQILEHFSVLDRFDVVAGATLDGSVSHKGDVVKNALVDLGAGPADRAVMVGDREHDVFGAKESGLASIGVLWGYGSEEELRAAGADSIAASIDALPALIAAALDSGQSVA